MLVVSVYHKEMLHEKKYIDIPVYLSDHKCTFIFYSISLTHYKVKVYFTGDLVSAQF
jgi:hypothetical protein